MNLRRDTARHRASTAAVLDMAWDAGVFGADDVMPALGLTRSTALAALDTLVEVSLVRELDSAERGEDARLGRPARRFELRADAGVVVGVDAGDRQLTAIVADLRGEVLATQKVTVRPYYEAPEKPRPDADPEERRTAVVHAIDSVLARTRKAREDVIAVAVGIPAPVDRDGRSPRHATGFWEHMNSDLRTALARVFPVARVENDASLAAVAERAFGAARGTDHFVAMLSGRRLGSGVFMDGQLLRGAHGGVGELEGLAFVPEVGGTWGLGYLAEAWVQAARRDGDVPPGHPWASQSEGDLTAEAVLAAASSSDPVSAPLVHDLGEKLGRICSVIARFHDPRLIVVCGATAGSIDELIEIARRRLAEDVELPPPDIVASTLGSDVVSLGAVAAAREAAREIVLPLLTGHGKTRHHRGGPGEEPPDVSAAELLARDGDRRPRPDTESRALPPSLTGSP